MRVGLIARADRTGLAAQTWSFWKNMKPDATLVVDLSRCSGQHPEMQRYAGDPNIAIWAPADYPESTPRPERIIEDFLDKVDVVFTCETPYNLWLFQRAREKGVRTVLQPNPEFLEYFVEPHLPKPDLFALPTVWLEKRIRGALPGYDIIHLPVPVDRELLPFRRRTSLQTILHTVGTGTGEDRNGTLLLVEAMHHVTTPVRARIRSQRPLGANLRNNTTVDLTRTQDYWELYGDEDLFVIPRRFGGLCLPMQEALAVGMPLLTTRASPQDSFLPDEMLVRAPAMQELMTRTLLGLHQADPVEIAQRIDWLYENPSMIAVLSDWADGWAQANSWEALRPRYEAALRGVSIP